ncbi:hypothetical protein LUZ63_009102 [Rhynchospora breviuscula]|uniref:Disease resistance R13L4/SHOC-2-like LRR domain-containing protein n=1 Tax=Rhynchospora breviuscula TaxID=2022672 RepID=A0A9Q0CF75_9POAL|nr:hypothetical protein LUZ63_009102 [Rhynchospora breviuscula]
MDSHNLSGEINSALLSIRHLTHLDISGHNFSNSCIPKFIGSFKKLVYLNLSFSFLQGAIPHEIGNLSHLQFLDLSGSSFTGLIPPEIGNLSDLRYLSLSYSYYYSSNPICGRLSWFSHLSNLRYLDLSWNKLSNKIDWSAINEMHLLEALMLSRCDLSEIPIDLYHVNLTSLTKLDLSSNQFNVTLPNWMWNFTGLLYIDLSYSKFQGSIPDTLSNLVSLNYLSLGGNNFEHVFLKPVSKLLNLRSLDLSELGIGGDVLNLIERLGNMWYNLEVVYLDNNNLSGNISSWITQMRNLSRLGLGRNSLSGHIPSDIGSLTHLNELDLSYNSLSGVITKDHFVNHSKLKHLDLSYNSLSGVITETHFVNLSKLKYLDLSHNMLTLKMNDKWVPPFQLEHLNLDSCKVGPMLPSWLRWQTQLLYVQLSNTSIAGVISTWFWNLPLIYIDMSYNNIRGSLPRSFRLSKIRVLNLRSNKINGLVPKDWGGIEALDLSNNNIRGTFLEFPQAFFVALSRNRISGTIPQAICNMSDLEVLQLSNNSISGEIPDCWKNISKLQYIDLSNNQINGELPSSIGYLQQLKTLQLYNNKLYGEIPSNLQWCKNLVFVSLGMNNLSGVIPTWISKRLFNIVVFQLRSNNFTGYIPSELGGLTKLQILDLAHNSLVGSIPSSIGNFFSMKSSTQHYNSTNDTSTMIAVGDLYAYRSRIGDFYEDKLYININGQHVYTSKPLELIKTIDISGNKLNGYIPEELWLLKAMINLNLSKNFLIGEIPENIGGMRSLESLDLSFNEFSGPIPQILSTLSSLHNLNLSYNNFSGKIPTGRQLDTLNDSSIYVGNSYLCGPPIDKSCSKDEASSEINLVNGNNRMAMIWLYLAIVLGFILGFWSIRGILIFINVWRVA